LDAGSIPASSTETLSKEKQKPVSSTLTGFFCFNQKQSKAEKSTTSVVKTWHKIINVLLPRFCHRKSTFYADLLWFT